MNLLAHTEPEESLLDHLKAVGQRAEGFLAPFGLASQGRIAGLVHDLGKATPFFQEMLQGKRQKGDPLTWHALPGALFAAWWARKEGLEEDALLLFLAVAEHHGFLKSPRARLPAELAKKPLPEKGAWVASGEITDAAREALKKRLPKKGAWGVLLRHLSALSHGTFLDLAQALGLPDPRPFLNGEALEEAARLAREANGLLRRGRDLELHYRLALLYSALLDADRSLAAGLGRSEAAPIPPGAVESYLAQKVASSPLTPHRKRLFQGVKEALRRPLAELFPARLTLSAPTGAGKTLAVLRFALELRERVAAELGFRPKIIYALPYISIADQVEWEAKAVLQEAGLDPDEALLVHHHLALARLSAAEGERVEERLLLQETWDRDLIVTTFHQVFPTLVGPGSELRRLHALAEGAILILDEVQTLPAELWPLIRALLRELPGRVTVVSMTATQPRLVEGLEVAPKLEGYPRRVQLRWGAPKTLEALAAHLLEEGPRSRLVVLNTVREAVELYRLLKEGGLPHLSLLTSYLIPAHRRARLEAIREELARGAPLTLVATQVVEAGVDLDFAEGYRALAPLESLLQSAGRVNRSARREATLWVLDLEGDTGTKVYGKVLLDRTRRVLKEELARGVWDLEAYELLGRYYELVEEGISQEKGERWLENLALLNYPDRPLSLIEEQGSLPIFVEWDEEAGALLEELREALELREARERMKRLRLLRPRLQAYTVSPLLRRALQNLPPPLLGREDWRHVPKEALADFYDEEVGFKWEMYQFL